MSLNPTTKHWLQSVTARYSLGHQIVVQQAESLLIAFRGLSPKTDYYTADDGQKDLLLLLFGVIPISFKGAHYNIPISMWIPLTYPREGPIIFVNPTPSMYIKPGRFVDLSGRVLHPSLTFWNQNTTLLDICHRLCQEFSLEPPVASKELNPNSSPTRPPLAGPADAGNNSLPRPVTSSVSPPPIPTKSAYSPGNSSHGSPSNSYIHHQQQFQSQNTAGSTSSLPRPLSAIPGNEYPNYQQTFHPPTYNHFYNQQQAHGTPSNSSSRDQSPQRPIQQSISSSNSPNKIHQPISVFSNQTSPKPPVLLNSTTYVPPSKPHLPTPTKSTFQPDITLQKIASLRHKLLIKVKEYLDGLEAATPGENERLNAIHRHLVANEHLINGVLTQCHHVLGMMEKNVELGEAKIVELTSFIKQMKEMPDFKPDADMKSPFLLEQQLCEVIAEYHAALDTLYYLSKRFGGSASTTPPDVFIKHVRQIAREMFMKKVIAAKILALLFTNKKS